MDAKVVFLIIIGIAIGGLVYFNLQKGNTNQVFNQTSEKQEINLKLSELKARDDLAVATVAGGCFWCMEGPFEQLDGVEEVISGFAGGSVEDPSYEQVLSGKTGHRESVQIFYDPDKVAYADLIKMFWWQIDPTDPGGQFADRGEHYTTAIFYHDEEQQVEADKQKDELNSSGDYDAPIATEILPFTTFFPAEDYHQDYYINSADRYERYEELSGRKGYKEQIKEKLGIE